MSRIPDDIAPIIQEIDNELKVEAVPTLGRPINAIIKFGQRFGLSMPITKPHPETEDELAKNWQYVEQIQRWYNTVYSDRIKLAPSADTKVAVLA